VEPARLERHSRSASGAKRAGADRGGRARAVRQSAASTVSGVSDSAGPAGEETGSRPKRTAASATLVNTLSGQSAGEALQVNEVTGIDVSVLLLALALTLRHEILLVGSPAPAKADRRALPVERTDRDPRPIAVLYLAIAKLGSSLPLLTRATAWRAGPGPKNEGESARLAFAPVSGKPCDLRRQREADERQPLLIHPAKEKLEEVAERRSAR